MKKITRLLILAALLAGGWAASEYLGNTRLVAEAGSANAEARLAETKAGPAGAGSPPEIGTKIDEFDGVAVYYNGPLGNVSGRNAGPDGYNIGQKYQCVEFVKRYYLEAKGHKMPDTWGHAKDFFNPDLPDGALNPARGLTQFKNGGKSRPEPGDLLVMGGNKYGHVGIISAVGEGYAEMVQQNPGPTEPSRIRMDLVEKGGGWTLQNKRVLGWLRLNR